MKERLSKIFGLMDQSTGNSTVREIPVDRVRANPFQPRRQFDEQELQELAASIETYGLLQPVLVRPRSNSWYELIAGERRVRAVRLLGRSTIPALVRDLEDQDVALLALLENLQRQDLSFGKKQKDTRVFWRNSILHRKSWPKARQKSEHNNKLRLLRLPDSIRHNISQEIFTERHARALLRLPDAETQEKVAKQIVSEKLTVQATEQLIERLVGETKPKKKKARFVRVYKDIRLFINSVRRAALELKKAGLNVTIDERETEDSWEISIVVPKQKSDKPKAKTKEQLAVPSVRD